MPKFDMTPGTLFPTFTVASAPAATLVSIGMVIYMSDGVAGSPGLVFSDGTVWKRVDTPATTAAAS